MTTCTWADCDELAEFEVGLAKIGAPLSVDRLEPLCPKHTIVQLSLSVTAGATANNGWVRVARIAAHGARMRGL